jgi:branched-chain amino acid transport system substrate-binding protein
MVDSMTPINTTIPGKPQDKRSVPGVRTPGTLRLSWGLLAAMIGLAGCYTNPTPAPIFVGHVSDKSRIDKAGDQAELGMRLALLEFKKQDPETEAFNGRSVEIRHTDAHGDLDAFEAEAVRLETVNRCVALMGGSSAKEVAALDHVKIPILTFHGQPVSGASNQVFYLGMSPVRQGEVLASVIADNAKAHKVVIVLDERRSESAALADAFQKALAEARKGDKLRACAVVTLRFGKDAGWPELIDQTRTQEPDAVVFAGGVQDFNAYHKLFRGEYFLNEPQLVYAGNDVDPRRADLAPGTKAAVLLASAFYADPAAEKTAAFMKAYRDAYQVEADVNAALAYDGFRILLEAMKKTAAQLTPERVREELLKTKDFEGMTGPLTIGADRQVQRPLHVLRWQNGTLTLVKTFGP